MLSGIVRTISGQHFSENPRSVAALQAGGPVSHPLFDIVPVRHALTAMQTFIGVMLILIVAFLVTAAAARGIVGD